MLRINGQVVAMPTTNVVVSLSVNFYFTFLNLHLSHQRFFLNPNSGGCLNKLAILFIENFEKGDFCVKSAM